jgi:trimeric autotransporter adhesin
MMEVLMNTGLRKSLSSRLCLVMLLAALFQAPLASQAQTFFGSGGSTNSATNVSNLAFGYNALASLTTGYQNTANGYQALVSNTTGNANTANGVQALVSNTTGNFNTADGFQALYSNTTGNNNVAIGMGTLSNSTASNNTAIGFQALASNITGSNNIAIGNTGLAADNGIIRIGTQGTQQATFIAGINGVTASQGVAVYINANGQLGTLTSSQRFKHDIQDLGSESDRLMNLRPVSFRYNEAAADGSHPIQYGLIAEEVAKVYPEMVQYDKEGKPFTIYYQQLTPMMLHELQKAHREIAALKADHKTEMTELKAEVEQLKQMLQKQNAETGSTSHPLALVSVLAFCLAGAILFSARGRLSR